MNRSTFVLSVAFILCLRYFASASSEREKADSVLAERGEVYLAFYPETAADLKPYLHDISIDRIENGYKVLAYADKQAFERVAQAGVPYEVLTSPCFTAKATMSDYSRFLDAPGPCAAKAGAHSGTGWYTYPTYDAFVQIMTRFQTDYPELAKLMELGPTVQNRKVYLLKVTGGVAAGAGKPRFLHISMVHGDEMLNYMNTLHMIDTLLSGYGSVPRFKTLLDNIEIWFVPLYNPDGCYKGGDSTVQSARRYNANNVDINRNYPCPCGRTANNHAVTGEYTTRQPENAALFNLWNRYVFHIAADVHSGSETMLWPYGSIARKPCDEDWYQWVCKRYVDLVHSVNASYFTQCGGDGMGNIYSELYECHGTSIDYSIFNLRGRTITMETSLKKMLAESDLRKYWEFNREPLLQLYEVLLTGIQGTVKNAVTKEPILCAKIQETTHDFDSAWTYTDSAGFYLRYIQKGAWNLTFSKPGFTSKTVALTVADYALKYPLDVELDPVTSVSDIAIPLERSFKVLPSLSGVLLINSDPIRTIKVALHAMDGALVDQMILKPGSKAVWPGIRSAQRATRRGCYVAKLTGGAGVYATRMVLNR
jgi:hypothetical protein